MIALYTSRDGPIDFPNDVTGFTAAFAEYGPFVYTPKVYPRYVNVPPALQNKDGTYNNTFTIGVYCGENTYPPVTADVLKYFLRLTMFSLWLSKKLFRTCSPVCFCSVVMRI